MKRLINAELRNTVLAKRLLELRRANWKSVWPSSVLKAVSRIAPQFVLNQMANLARPKKWPGLNFQPKPNPQILMPYTTSAYLGVPAVC